MHHTARVILHEYRVFSPLRGKRRFVNKTSQDTQRVIRFECSTFSINNYT